jgi:site-specific DNA-cytosine methylase
VHDLRGFGYDVVGDILAVADYGVAQMRKRLFMVGVKGKKVAGFPPSPSHLKVDGTQLNFGLPACSGRCSNDAQRDAPEAELIRARPRCIQPMLGSRASNQANDAVVLSRSSPSALATRFGWLWQAARHHSSTTVILS